MLTWDIYRGKMMWHGNVVWSLMLQIDMTDDGRQTIGQLGSSLFDYPYNPDLIILDPDWSKSVHGMLDYPCDSNWGLVPRGLTRPSCHELQAFSTGQAIPTCA